MADFVSYIDWLSRLNWLEKGDCVYVVSDMLELAKAYRDQNARLDLDQVIDGLQELVGEKGTLLFPTFNWDFCKGVSFDYYKTPGRTGALSKAAMKRQDFKRTFHPIYSFAVWGVHKQVLMENRAVDSFGPGTIFEKMLEWNAKVLVIGLTPLQGVTYVHHVEQMVGVPYRYYKEFSGEYMDENGICSQRTYRMYVRDLDINPQEINGFLPLAEQMKIRGMIQSSDYYDSVACHVMRISDVDKAARKDILENGSKNMYFFANAPE